MTTDNKSSKFEQDINSLLFSCRFLLDSNEILFFTMVQNAPGYVDGSTGDVLWPKHFYG